MVEIYAKRGRERRQKICKATFLCAKTSFTSFYGHFCSRPEALGLVAGVVFLICAILSQLAFANNNDQVWISIFINSDICIDLILTVDDLQLCAFLHMLHDLLGFHRRCPRFKMEIQADPAIVGISPSSRNLFWTYSCVHPDEVSAHFYDRRPAHIFWKFREHLRDSGHTSPRSNY